MNNTPKLCFIDTETTGLDRNKDNIFQISAKITDPKANEILDEINLTFVPHSLENYEIEALEKTGYTIEQLSSFPLSSPDAFKQFTDWLATHVNRFDRKDKLQFLAYNAPFDSEFVRQWFLKNNDNYFGSFFWNPAICVMQASAWFVQSVRGSFPNFKLATICECAELGWDEDSAHDANYDVTKTVELYRYLRENLSQL
jgi:DNA polymerase-3 subunit epsilon